MTDFRPRGFQVLPTVVKNLVIINVIMVILQFVLWNTFKYNLSDVLGLHYWRSTQFRPWQLITHMFMHGAPNDLNLTVLHIFSNMFALWMFGSVLENLWGPKRFLTFYMICGIGAALCHMGVLAIQYEPVYKAFVAYQHNPTLDNFEKFFREQGRPVTQFIGSKINTLHDLWQADPGSSLHRSHSVSVMYDYLYGVNAPGNIHWDGLFDEATVGASGAVFGVLFAYGYLFPNTLLYFYFFIPIKAKWFIGAYALFELYAGVRNSAGDNVAHFAHLGGMLFAFILLKIWNNRYRQRFY